MTTSQSGGNFGRKFLQCLTCSSFQWLDEAMLVPAPIAGCFSCGETSHWKSNCPWLQSKCKICDVTRSLKVSGKQQTYGWKFLKCPKCSRFQWLYEAIKTAQASTSAEVTLTMKLADFCNSFEAKCTMKK
ncbi:Zinc finger protein [Thalictrum thalictroides]|uniref:Zinc finger protein n=1 Tax=Thalictrum thalictroides TaxID=46969 RepID=A0A7J6X2K6_THATH|nr:Zinc finger protein [Thalictrum thalictroides]